MSATPGTGTYPGRPPTLSPVDWDIVDRLRTMAPDLVLESELELLAAHLEHLAFLARVDRHTERNDALIEAAALVSALVGNFQNAVCHLAEEATEIEEGRAEDAIAEAIEEANG
jgi:hypothetical protein